ncbi:MAG: hypothetical protein GY776_01125 [Alteromonas sp.]|nr:hypothetical protein [Alteromonas sp.]
MAEAVVMFDVNEKLIFWNQAYREHYEEDVSEPRLKSGLKFEQLVRARAFSNKVPDEAVGRREGYVTDRMKRFRNPCAPFEGRRGKKKVGAVPDN